LTVNGNTELEGSLDVDGAVDLDSTLNVEGATTLNSTLDVDGATTLNSTLTVAGHVELESTLDVDGAVDLDSTLNVEGATTLNSTLDVYGATNIYNTFAVDSNGATPGGSTLTVNDSQIIAQTEDGSGLIINNGGDVKLLNSTGHGITISPTETVLSGGTTSTTLTLNNSGATFRNTVTGGPARVTGVNDGVYDFDVVNVRQFRNALEKANIGIASVSALSAIPATLPGKRFAIGAGYGYYESESAVALGLKAKLWESISVQAGIGFGVGQSESTYSANAGISFSF
ncbi:MAG: YadA-like family protein, partial [Deltaproteobacteria bacterium]|nr:YadA-like family protein [Deltaproteobacteria bacterium]